MREWRKGIHKIGFVGAINRMILFSLLFPSFLYAFTQKPALLSLVFGISYSKYSIPREINREE